MTTETPKYRDGQAWKRATNGDIVIVLAECPSMVIYKKLNGCRHHCGTAFFNHQFLPLTEADLQQVITEQVARLGLITPRSRASFEGELRTLQNMGATPESILNYLIGICP